MRIKFVYGFLPALIFIDDSMVPDRFGAYCRGIVIAIREKHKDNKCLLLHELEHVKQNYRLYFNHLKREVAAYTVQVRCHPGPRHPVFIRAFARVLSSGIYDAKFTVTREEAERLLWEKYNNL